MNYFIESFGWKDRPVGCVFEHITNDLIRVDK